MASETVRGARMTASPPTTRSAGRSTGTCSDAGPGDAGAALGRADVNHDPGDLGSRARPGHQGAGGVATRLAANTIDASSSVIVLGA